MDTLKQAVEEFMKAKKYIHGFNKDTVERLLRGNTSKASKKQGDKVKITKYAFLNQAIIKSCESRSIDDPSILESIGAGIRKLRQAFASAPGV